MPFSFVCVIGLIFDWWFLCWELSKLFSHKKVAFVYTAWTFSPSCKLMFLINFGGIFSDYFIRYFFPLVSLLVLWLRVAWTICFQTCLWGAVHFLQSFFLLLFDYIISYLSSNWLFSLCRFSYAVESVLWTFKS